MSQPFLHYSTVTSSSIDQSFIPKIGFLMMFKAAGLPMEHPAPQRSEGSCRLGSLQPSRSISLRMLMKPPGETAKGPAHPLQPHDVNSTTGSGEESPGPLLEEASHVKQLGFIIYDYWFPGSFFYIILHLFGVSE